MGRSRILRVYSRSDRKSSAVLSRSKERVGIERWGSVVEEVEWIGMVEEVVEEVDSVVNEVVKESELGVRGLEKKLWVEELIEKRVLRNNREIGKYWNEYNYDEGMRDAKFSGEDRWMRVREDNEVDMFL